MPFINLYLSNARDYPLDLELTAMGIYESSCNTVGDLRAFLGPENSLLISHMIQQTPRCKRLVLNMESYTFTLAPDSVLESLSFPHLELIEHSILYGPRNPDCILFFQSVQARAPKLTTAIPYNTEEMMPLPFRQLQALQFRKLSSESHIRLLLDTLAPCTNIRSLEFDVAEHKPLRERWPKPIQTVLLPHLRVLLAGGQIASCLEILNAPSLAKVELSGRAEVASALVRLIKQSKCQLNELSITLESRCPPEVLTEAIQATPSLRSLEIIQQSETRYSSLQTLKVLKDLTVGDTQTPLAPKLRSLTVEEMDSEITMDAASDIIKLLESRSRPNLDADGSSDISPLESADFQLSCSESSEDRNVFALRQVGLNATGVGFSYGIATLDTNDLWGT